MGASICDMHQDAQKHSLESVKSTRAGKNVSLCAPFTPVQSKHDLLPFFAATPYTYIYIYIQILHDIYMYIYGSRRLDLDHT